MYCLSKFFEFIHSEGVELWASMLNELESTLSEADELLNKHPRFHGQVTQALNRFTKL